MAACLWAQGSEISPDRLNPLRAIEPGSGGDVTWSTGSEESVIIPVGGIHSVE